MNASVQQPDMAGANWTGPADYRPSFNANQTRQFAASEQAAHFQPAWPPQTPSPYALGLLQQASQPLLSTPAPTQKWHSYALPTSSVAEFGPAPELLDQNEQQPPDEASEYEDEEATGAATDYGTPQPPPPPPLSQDEAEPDEQDEDQTEPDELTDAPPGSELDELAQRRAFSELESATNERDKDGSLLVTRRRHLINGRPVKARRAPADVNQAESRRATKLNKPAQDFEQLVEELDEEDRLRKLKRPPARSSLAGRSGRSHANLERRPRDDSTHKLQETLTQQQWDDDATSSSAARRPRGRAAADERLMDVASQEEEARKVEQASQDLLLNPDFAELTRRRRETVKKEEEEESQSSATNVTGAPMLSENDERGELVQGQEDMHVEVLAQPVVASYAPHVAQPMVTRPGQLAHFPRIASPLASGSSKVDKRKKQNKKTRQFSKKLLGSKYKAARAYHNRQRSKQKTGKMRKKKRKLEKKLLAGKKQFAGATRGHRQARGRGQKGARKGATFYKDKGYKKKGFKKAYHKLETGDHKTYFDEFRDKDLNKKWKNFDDRHKYSQKKKWAGHDLKHMRHHDSKEARGKASKSGRWKERDRSEHMRKIKKFRQADKSKAASSKMGAEVKKRTKSAEV